MHCSNDGDNVEGDDNSDRDLVKFHESLSPKDRYRAKQFTLIAN